MALCNTDVSLGHYCKRREEKMREVQNMMIWLNRHTASWTDGGNVENFFDYYGKV